MAASADKEIKIDMEKLSVREADEKMFVREKEKEEIILQLMSAVTNPPAVPVIIIAGIPGIGKTILARHVCDSVQEQIGKPVWVENVSPFDPNNMAKQVIGDNNTAASSSTVNPNRIIILDGFEAEIQHDQLKALQDKLLEKGIRVAAIIITTRSSCCVVKNIIADSPVKSYALEGLNKEDSLSLFQTILGPDAAHHSSITQDVVNKNCRGVPWAIQIMAEFLRPSGLTEFMGERYEGLPRSCFTYCSLLPQDYEFDAERLIHLWAAEGFLESSNPSTSPEDIGRDCLRKLAGKSIFHDVEKDEFGEIRSCKMHPLMHGIARFLLLNDTENIPLDPYGEEKVHDQLLRASFDLSLLGMKDGIPASLFDKAKQLKTILFFKTGLLQVGILKKMFKSFKKLRVLDLRDAGIDEVPDSIGEMKELEYLDLSLNGMEKLPNSISKLSKLQTLKLYCCHSLKELPKNFEKLKNLKHLDMRLCMALTCMPREMNRLTSLQTLSAFAVSKKDPRKSLEELAKLTQLRGYLDIFYLDRVPKPLENEETKYYLKEIQNLDSLTLRWDLGDTKGSDHKSVLDRLEPHSNLRALILEGYGGPTLSSWLTSSSLQFKGLVRLRLEDCRKCKSLSEQDRLPKLKILQLVRLDNLEYIIANNCDTCAYFYENLEELTIEACPKLKSWWQTEIEVKQRPFFAKISKLDVRQCPKLTCMPLYPRLEGSTFSFGKEVFLEDSSLKLLLDTRSTKSAIIPLENLHIQDCIQLDKLFDAFKHMSSLQCLTLREIPNLESLTFDNLTTLRELTLHSCHGLTSISESIGKVTSLRRLIISKCNKLESLPKAMSKIELKTLIILDCDKLRPRCQPDTGDDWPQIRHIKQIQVK